MSIPWRRSTPLLRPLIPTSNPTPSPPTQAQWRPHWVTAPHIGTLASWSRRRCTYSGSPTTIRRGKRSRGMGRVMDTACGRRDWVLCASVHQGRRKDRRGLDRAGGHECREEHRRQRRMGRPLRWRARSGVPLPFGLCHIHQTEGRLCRIRPRHPQCLSIPFPCWGKRRRRRDASNRGVCGKVGSLGRRGLVVRGRCSERQAEAAGKRVRGTIGVWGWRITGGQGGCDATFVVQADVGGTIPSAMVKIIQTQTPLAIKRVSISAPRARSRSFSVRATTTCSVTPRLYPGNWTMSHSNADRDATTLLSAFPPTPSRIWSNPAVDNLGRPGPPERWPFER
ncbi:hypothetical protein BJ742DRAFT_89495 [Cladochytrium replicatum]|nr:hypothetical protein BJ742DRAFT_89495 [Cladochytrium replicatum]